MNLTQSDDEKPVAAGGVLDLVLRLQVQVRGESCVFGVVAFGPVRREV